MSKSTKIILIVIILIAVWLGVRFIIGEPEDTWICENGEWVKHGNPSAAKPAEPCEKSKDGYFENMASGLNQAKEINRQSYTIDLSNQGLKSFPFEILGETNKTILDLSNNRLTSLPSEIGELTRLEEFYVDHNNLTGALPAEIRKFSGLKVLDASFNDLTGIPAEIGQMSKLEDLDLSFNNIDTYPNEIANIKGNLKLLNIAGNKFSTGKIDELKKLLPNTNIVVDIE